MIHTHLCDLLAIDHPILNAPMGGTATATLAAAVSNAGGFGMIGGTSPGGPDWLRSQIRAARAQTNRPFGVGFISSFPNIDDLVQVALDEQVAAINHSFADPTPYVAAARARGIRVFAQVQSLAQAQRAAKAGVDAIIAQGTEAGGHTGTAGTLALLPAVVDSVGGIPVLAAGGVADRRGLAAVLMLGAAGASLGTRFVASDEWGGGDWEQQAVLDATTDDTIRTSLYDQIRGAAFPADIADRVLRNRFNTAWNGRTTAITEQRADLQRQLEAGAKALDKEVVDISAGLAAGLIRSQEPAGLIVQRIVAEAEQVLQRSATLLRSG
ncbi:2-nitropropane dioxygenase [Kouleothrix aurantiaca]|uniref:2-nitropropane dioxygenase n=1 Tax=Kouleothrix aurantiaca TaxID=186479 RepID=A0A0P9HFN8_9CHLR|nr:2-nitropropane dioxygenase [Kouleothrix aurantiaca]